MKLKFPEAMSSNANVYNMTLEVTTAPASGTVDLWLVTRDGSRVAWWQLDKKFIDELLIVLVMGTTRLPGVNPEDLLASLMGVEL